MGISLVLSTLFAGTGNKDIYKQVRKNQSLMNDVYRHLITNYVDDIDLDAFTKMSINNMLLELDPYTVYLENEEKSGIEDSAKFWMEVHNVDSIDKLKDLIDFNRVEKFKETNKMVYDMANESFLDFDLNLDFLKKEKKPNHKYIKLLDEFNDKKASKRIIIYMENEYE